jgi:hypothetical protein
MIFASGSPCSPFVLDSILTFLGLDLFSQIQIYR